MANNIDEIMFDVGAGIDAQNEPRLYEQVYRIVTKAHPFTEDDLRAFAVAGEHSGLE